uniref:Uncharacterized protein n=1 Tax=Tanacetum cinerariifolium TaxID=118510 RepID=A0A699GRM2_TANCI|nr:hypothetical protein [Tanacetum cinerariifolium]
MNNKKCIVNLEYFREMLKISLRIPNQQFDELPFEEEIVAFLRELGHIGEIKMITDVNINKLHQPRRSFAAVINKCLSGKSTDFVYQVEHKDAKKSNEMYYPRFTKVIINFFMTKDQSIPKRNKYDVILPVELTNEAIKNSESYKEYYAIASVAELPRQKQVSRRSKVVLKLQCLLQLKAKDSRFQQRWINLPRRNNMLSHLLLKKSSEEDDDNNDDDKEKISEHDDDVDDQSDDDQEDQDDDDQDDHDNNDDQDEQDDNDDQDDQDNDDDEQTDSDNDSDDFIHPNFSTHDKEAKDEESFDLIVRTPSHDDKTDDEDNDEDSDGINVEGDKGANKEDDADELYRDVNINLKEFMQTNQFTEAVSSILDIVDKYIDYQMNKVVKVAVRIQSDRLRDEAQAENEDFLNKLDENIQKIIKEQVKVQVSKILPKIEKTVNEQLEMESNKSIHRSDEQKNLYKALVDAYECDKLILDTYGDTVTLKRRRDDEDKDEEPSAGSNRGSKRRREGKEPESTSASKEKTSGKPTEGSKSQHKIGATDDQHVEEASHNLAKKADSRTSFNELMDTPVDFSAFMMNQLKVDTLTPKLLVGLTYELMKGSCKSLVELEFFLEEVYKATTDQLDWNNPKGQQYLHDLQKPLPLIPNSRGGESARDVYSKHRIITVTELQIIEWHNYKHLDWITIRRDDDKLYKFKEGDFKMLRIQDIEDMLLLLVQGNIAIQWRVEDLQLGVESYQKKLNLTKPDTYRSDLKHKEAYTTYSNPRGFIYQNKDKQNRLMRIDELHKFSDDTLNDVRTALDDRLKGIRMQYLPQTIWR